MNKIKKIIYSIVRFIQYGDLPLSYYMKKGMIVGKNFNRQSGCKFDPSHCWLIRIGDNVTCSNRVVFLAHDDSCRNATGFSRIGTITVGDNTFIGANVTILPNVEIGNNVIIGACSLVTHNIPDNSVVVGVPCKIISSTDEYITKMLKKINMSQIFDINSTIYSKKRMSKKKKNMMYDNLKSKEAFIYLDRFRYEK